MTYDDVQAKNFRKFQNDHADRLVVGGSPCTYFYAPDYRTITDKAIREALLWAIPYEDQRRRLGPDPGGQRDRVDPDSCLRASRAARSTTRCRTTRRSQTDPEKAKQILADSGNEGYEIKFLFRTDIDTDVTGQGRPGQGPRGGRLQGDPGRRPPWRTTRPTVTT